MNDLQGYFKLKYFGARFQHFHTEDDGIKSCYQRAAEGGSEMRRHVDRYIKGGTPCALLFESRLVRLLC